MTTELWFIALAIFVIVAVLLLVYNSVKIISPYEQGLYIRLGTFIKVLDPGLNVVTPIVSQVVKMDLRTQVLDVPRQEVITKDNSPTNVDAIIYVKVIDPSKAYFQVTNYRAATVYLAQTTLRSVVGDMELDEILSSREKINLKLRDILDEATDKWGVKVEAVEIREVDPAPKVKTAMEEQTSAERMRRATILRADGEKTGAILSAEGQKRARILQAEGVRQSKVLEAEGERLAIILQSQGEAQKLRILSVGASPLDSKALTVLSLQTMQALGEGQSTKWIVPFELSRVMEGVSEYLGTGRQTPARDVTSQEDIERAVGRPEDILGPIPTAEELRAELKNLEESMELEKAKAEAIAKDKDKHSV
ncbi:SPFH domain-containing protein [Methanomassiliicoccus luminyensis]|jgi:regulator of protease activity HflC (stomatin/prohibitin superfamily)|uniref:SPFH domain-containing protein n=1 Tax=Methanomassiliicoccus luminyensis TaxID=1080712 RepID=UPI0004746B35|nr:SPFH domain-containing protein [Methanomassiliicoccus luminyensis]